MKKRVPLYGLLLCLVGCNESVTSSDIGGLVMALVFVVYILATFMGEPDVKEPTDPMIVSEEDMKRVYANMDKAERINNLSTRDMDSMLNLIIKNESNTLQEILDAQKIEIQTNEVLSDPKIMTEVFLLYKTMKDMLTGILRESFFSKNIDLEYNLYLQTIDKVRNQIKRKARNDIMLNNAKYFLKIDQVALKFKDQYKDFLFVGAFQQLVDELYKEDK